ncbi:helix-turn-helix domain-containing protein [Nocardia sp. NPDC088792]|uniref:helix-turn-helix domain-containing protein n=1 Tax=Nocardia sp. NPDC088792 TaxID=3364332 RepID=UPI00381CE093
MIGEAATIADVTAAGHGEAMSELPRPRLSRIIDALGSTLLRRVAGPVTIDRPVGSVSIYDPADGVDVAADGLLLGVGVTDSATATTLLTELRRRGAAALLLKAPMDEAVRQAADAAGITVLEVSRATSWEQLVFLLRTLIDLPDRGDAVTEYPTGDLFQLANAIGALLDAPITIEDRSSRVLAFSGGQDRTDESRVQTVLGRQVPEHYQRLLLEQGVFRELYRSREPVYIPALTESSKPRTAIAVRAGEEVLGSLWAVVSEPLTEHRRRAFVEATKIVALHLLRDRAGRTAGTRPRAELVTRLLEQTGNPADTARRLGIGGRSVCVLALELDPREDCDEVARAAEIRRVADALALHLSALHPSAAATMLGEMVYGLLPLPESCDGESTAQRVATDFLERMGARIVLHIGIGRAVREPGDIIRSRTDADCVLRILRERGHGNRVATVRSVRPDLMLACLAEAAERDDRPYGDAVARLLHYDAEHRGDLTGTLAAYLEAFGDITKAANAVHVHPNTFRYRLTRLCEVGGLDLTDPDARFEAQIDLRLHRLHRSRSAAEPARSH